MPEEFTLHNARREASQIDAHIAAVCTLREIVDRPREDFLARAGFALQQHVSVGTGRHWDLRNGFLKC